MISQKDCPDDALELLRCEKRHIFDVTGGTCLT
jgi:hypothetical protein